jgi:hypothetical protein
VSYIVWHPGTGTIVSAEESVLVEVSQLPADFDELEDYLETYGAPSYKITPGKELL